MRPKDFDQISAFTQIIKQYNNNLLSYINSTHQSIPKNYSALILLMILDTYPKQVIAQFLSTSKILKILKENIQNHQQFKEVKLL